MSKHGAIQQIPATVLLPRQTLRASEEEDEGPMQEEETGLRVQSGGGDLARALYADPPSRVFGRVRAVRLQDRVTLEGHRPAGVGHENSTRRDLDS